MKRKDRFFVVDYGIEWVYIHDRKTREMHPVPIRGTELPFTKDVDKAMAVCAALNAQASVS